MVERGLPDGREGRANGACGLPRASFAVGSGRLCGAIATLCLKRGIDMKISDKYNIGG